MQFQYEGETYDVRFNHGYVENKLLSGIWVRETTCTFSVVDPTVSIVDGRYQPVSLGIATTHVRDRFVKKIGRRISLRKAIDNFMKLYVEKKYAHGSMANKKIRKRIWASYFFECEMSTHVVNKKEAKKERENERELGDVMVKAAAIAWE